MHYEFDPVKDDSNFKKHGMSLSDAEGFDWETAFILEDRRQAYAEARFEAKGYVGDRLCVVVFVCAQAQCASSVCARPIYER